MWKGPLLFILLVGFFLSPAVVLACDATCQATVNVPLLGNSTRAITSDIVLVGDLDGCSFTIDVTQVSCANVGTPVPYGVTFTSTDGTETECSGVLVVEDKTKPVFSNCPATVTVPCFAGTSPAAIAAVAGPVTATDNCGVTSLAHQDFLEPFGDCDDDILTRTWIAQDASGNSATCMQTITLAIPATIDITWPESPVTIGSGSVTETDEAGHPAPSLTGEPAFESCGQVAAIYEDEVTSPETAATLKITRTWTVLDWCHPGVVYSFEQLISVTGNPNRVACIEETDECFGNVQDAVDNASDGSTVIVTAANDLGDISLTDGRSLTIVIEDLESLGIAGLGQVTVRGGSELSLAYTGPAPGVLTVRSIVADGAAVVSFATGDYAVQLGENGSGEAALRLGDGSGTTGTIAIKLKNNGDIVLNAPIVADGDACIVADGENSSVSCGAVYSDATNGTVQLALEGPIALTSDGTVDLQNLSLRLTDGATATFNGPVVNGGPPFGTIDIGAYFSGGTGTGSSDNSGRSNTDNCCPGIPLSNGTGDAGGYAGFRIGNSGGSPELNSVVYGLADPTAFYGTIVADGIVAAYDKTGDAPPISPDILPTVWHLEPGYAPGTTPDPLAPGTIELMFSFPAPAAGSSLLENAVVAFRPQSATELQYQLAELHPGQVVTTAGEQMDAGYQSVAAVASAQAGDYGIFGCPECGEGKVQICQVPPGNPDKAKTKCIDRESLVDQLNNGGYCGPCQETASANAQLGIPTTTEWAVGIFPNPVRDDFRVEFSQAATESRQLRLVDLNGRTVREQRLPAGAVTAWFAVADLPTGVYVLHAPDAEQLQTWKVVVE